MWWRALGVAVVLLCVGVAGGYAVGERTTDAPVATDSTGPVPAQSPAVPTPAARDYRPDPDDPALEPGLAATTTELRIDGKRGPGVTVAVPDGWRVNPIVDASAWVASDPEASSNTYSARISYVRNQNASIGAVKAGRLAALREAESNGGIDDFEVTADVEDGFEATYVSGDYLRVTMEQYVSFDGSHAYAGAAVTGRVEDEAGLRDLLARTVASMEPLAAKTPKPESDATGQVNPSGS